MFALNVLILSFYTPLFFGKKNKKENGCPPCARCALGETEGVT